LKKINRIWINLPSASPHFALGAFAWLDMAYLAYLLSELNEK